MAFPCFFTFWRVKYVRLTKSLYFSENFFFFYFLVCILGECRTLWGEREWIQVQNMEQLHALDSQQSITETTGYRLWHNKFKHMHNTGTVSQAPAGRSHMAYIDVLRRALAAHHMLCRTHGTWSIDVCSLHHDGMDRWKHFHRLCDMH